MWHVYRLMSVRRRFPVGFLMRLSSSLLVMLSMFGLTLSSRVGLTFRANRVGLGLMRCFALLLFLRSRRSDSCLSWLLRCYV